MARVKGHHLRWTRVCQSASIINNLDLGVLLKIEREYVIDRVIQNSMSLQHVGRTKGKSFSGI